MARERRPMLADPGIGKESAPIGTIDWARYQRLAMQSATKDLEKAMNRMQGYVDLVQKHRAWSLLTNESGAAFASWEEFCEAEQPYGLGKPWPEIRTILEAWQLRAEASK